MSERSSKESIIPEINLCNNLDSKREHLSVSGDKIKEIYLSYDPWTGLKILNLNEINRKKLF